jgi:uncharacterized protein (DUF4415 family)
VSDDTSRDTSKTEPATDWRRLRAMKDEEVHAAITTDPDIAPTDDAFWKDARVIVPHQRETVTIDLDADVLEWFRGKRGFQAENKRHFARLHECTKPRELMMFQYPIAHPSLRPSDPPMRRPRCQSMAIAWAPPQGRSRTAT